MQPEARTQSRHKDDELEVAKQRQSQKSDPGPDIRRRQYSQDGVVQGSALEDHAEMQSPPSGRPGVELKPDTKPAAEEDEISVPSVGNENHLDDSRFIDDIAPEDDVPQEPPSHTNRGDDGETIPLAGQSDDTAVPPPSVLTPHLSTPGMRGGRPSQSIRGTGLNAKMRRTPPQAQAKSKVSQGGPLSDLISWLADADVGDVLDANALSELLPTHYHDELFGRVPPSRPSPNTVAHSDVQNHEIPDGGSAVGGYASDDLEDVPSDKEGQPSAPPLASPASPFMVPPMMPPIGERTRSRTQGKRGQKPAAAPFPAYCSEQSGAIMEAHSEDDEWNARQRLTGAIGRLVRYAECDIPPKDDILGLRCTSAGRLMVTAVRENGKACKAGVAAGDELVSVDGRKDFMGHPADKVHASLRAPITLVFLGFVGKLQAEVRVKRPPEPKCGLAPDVDVLVSTPQTKTPLTNVQYCDAVVFQQGQSKSLLITAGSSDDPRADGNPASSTTKDPSEPKDTIMYELQREDARNLVFNSLDTTATL